MKKSYLVTDYLIVLKLLIRFCILTKNSWQLFFVQKVALFFSYTGANVCLVCIYCPFISKNTVHINIFGILLHNTLLPSHFKYVHITEQKITYRPILFKMPTYFKYYTTNECICCGLEK